VKPYYADDTVTLYLGDAAELIRQVLSVGAAHTVLTDPPFFMPAQQYAGRSEAWQRTWADTSILSTWWGIVVDALTSRVREEGHLMAFCDHASYAVFYPAVYTRWPNVTCLTWDKGRPGMGSAWRASTEFIIAARGRSAHWSGGAAGTLLRFPSTHSSERYHPVDKPVPLLRALLSPTTPPGGLVLDPFAGGGSTLLAARDLGMRAVGIEAEERYCEAIVKRLQQDVLPILGEA
jgi:hypothetical protein